MSGADSEWLRKKARSAYKSGEMEQSLAYYQRLFGAETRPPSNAQECRDHVEFGTALFRSRRMAEAAREFEIVVQAEPDNAPAFHKLGLAAVRLGRPQRALEAFRAAAKLEPKEASYQWAYAEVAIAMGEREEAEAALDASLAIDPENAEALAAKARLSAEPQAALGGPMPQSVPDADFAKLADFIRNRPTDDEISAPRAVDTSLRPLIYSGLGALTFLVGYLYVRVVMIG